VAWHPNGRARVSASSPRAKAVCDRCGFLYSRTDLRWQSQWEGTQLQNLGILVCSICLDKPQMQLRAIILPPDPTPIEDPRPERYAMEVPSYVSTEAGVHFVTMSGLNLTTEIRVTPSPDPNTPYYFVPE